MKKNSWAEGPSSLVNLCDFHVEHSLSICVGKDFNFEWLEQLMIKETKNNHSPHILFFFSSSFLPPFLILRILKRCNLEKWMTTLFTLHLSQIQSVHPFSSLPAALWLCAPQLFPPELLVQQKLLWKYIFEQLEDYHMPRPLQCFIPIPPAKKVFWCLDRKHIESSWQSKMCCEAEDEMSCPLNS